MACLRSFFFLNVGIYCYKVLSRKCFCWFPSVLECCISIFICLMIFFDFLISSLIHLLFKSVVFNFHIFVNFPTFLLLLIFNFIPLWSEKLLNIISIFLNLLRPVLWLNTWSILENVLCGLDKNMYPSAVGGNVLYMSVRSIWSNMIQVQHFLVDFLSGWSIYCWKWGTETPYYCCIAVYFCLQIH